MQETQETQEMQIEIRPYQEEDTADLVDIWNEVVETGEAFPQLDFLTQETGADFFQRQDYVGVALAQNRIVGLYILHPNNVGRCGHHANASYAVSSQVRGCKIGERLIRHSLETARQFGYRLLIFNAVVKENYSAVHLYEKLGFHRVGQIPGGFLRKDEEYVDTYIYYYEL